MQLYAILTLVLSSAIITTLTNAAPASDAICTIRGDICGPGHPNPCCFGTTCEVVILPGNLVTMVRNSTAVYYLVLY